MKSYKSLQSLILIGVMIILIVLMSGLSSASISKELTLAKDIPTDSKTNYGTIKIIDKGFLGDTTLVEQTLESNTETCDKLCSAQGRTNLIKDGVLFDKISFRNKFGKSMSNYVKNVKLYYSKDKVNWNVYNYQNLNAGIWYWKIEAEKTLNTDIDWVITSQGKELTEWAFWYGTSEIAIDSFDAGAINGSLWISFVNGTTMSITQANGLLNITESGGTTGSYRMSNFSTNLTQGNLWTRFNVINITAIFKRVLTGGGGLNKDYIYLTNGSKNVNIYEFVSTYGSSQTVNDIKVSIAKSGNTYNSNLDGSSVTSTSLSGNVGIGFAIVTDPATANHYISLEAINGSKNDYITLNSPANTSINNLVFESSEDLGGITINNATIFIWNSLGIIVNQTTKSLTGTQNQTTFNITRIAYGVDYLWNVLACSGNNCYFANSNSSFSYTPTPNAVLYNITTTEGKTEGYIFNLSYDSLVYPFISASLNYNNTFYGSTKIGSGNDIILTNSLTTPYSSSVVNKSFYWQIKLIDTLGITTYINSSWNNQTINKLGLDSCTTYTKVLINFSLFDEDARTNLNGTIQALINIYNLGTSNSVMAYNLSISNTNNLKVCVQNEILNTTSYTMNYQVIYSNETHVTEYKYGQGITISNNTIPININLYDLLSTNSQAITLSVIGADSLRLQGVVVDLQRQYVPINQFLSVESPITDSSGNAIAHVVLRDAIYNILIYQNGVLVGTFDNYKFECANPLSGCTVLLPLIQAVAPIDNYYNYKNLNYYYDLNIVTRTLRMLFYTSDNAPHQVSWNVVTNDGYGNTTICTNSILISSGTFTCNIPISYGNLSIIALPSIDGNYLSGKFMSLDSRPADTFGGTRILLAMLMYSTITLLFVSNPIMIVVGAILGIAFATGLFLLDGGSLFGTGSILIWFVIAGVIIIWRANRSKV